MHDDACVRPAPGTAPAPHARDYIQTTATGNAISRRAAIYGAAHIVLGGKCIVEHRAVIRGDLTRALRAEDAERSGTSMAISMGRYGCVGERAILRPPSKIYQGHFSYFPQRIGDYVYIGARAVVEASQIGSYVEIGEDCVVGPSCVIRDCAVLLPGAVLAPETVVPSLSIFGGAPAQFVAPLLESFQEDCEDRARGAYGAFPAALAPRRS